MPKKFASENSKAVAARTRKQQVKEAEESRKQEKLDEEYWREDDKHILRKQQRKQEQELKRAEVLQKKAEIREALVAEEQQISTSTKGKPKVEKVTVRQIQIAQEKEERKAAVAAALEKRSKDDEGEELPIEENVNRLYNQLDHGDAARSVADAIAILSTAEDEVDKHPERRAKAAFKAYESHRVEELRAENPSLKLSQIRQILRKEWTKSPLNPYNQSK